jgi:leucine dehydrogenase
MILLQRQEQSMTGALPETTSHEAVHLVDEPELGLFGVIAIHSTVLGPAGGGCRIWRYDTRAELLADALRLSRGMTYKNAMAGLPMGGGKAVLQIEPGFDRGAALGAFGRAVERLGGRYVTAEDVGSSVEDMRVIAGETRHVAGLPVASDAAIAGGDPSPWTALGTFLSIELAVRRRLGRSLDGVTVAVQGLGNVGGALCRMLSDAGARLIVADTDRRKALLMCNVNGATECAVERIHAAEADVFAPCALGGAITAQTASELHASVVCGAANNQLAADDLGRQLRERGVLYAPDYVVNAGGIINVAAEWLREPGAAVEARVRRIPERLAAVFDRAETEDVATNVAADRLVDAMLAEAREVAA